LDHRRHRLFKRKQSWAFQEKFIIIPLRASFPVREGFKSYHSPIDLLPTNTPVCPALSVLSVRSRHS
jgi:hypothetical protein